MVHRDPKTHCRAVAAIAPASYGTGATNGTGFTKTGFDYAMIILKTGVLGASATLDVKVQESDTLGSGYTDVTGAAFSQKVKASDDNLIYVAQMQLSKRKKFLRVVGTVGAAASIFDVSVVLLEGDRSDGVSIAQAASEAKASPVAASGAGSYEFSV